MDYYVVALSILVLLSAPKTHGILSSFDARYSGTSAIMQTPVYYGQKSGIQQQAEKNEQTIRERLTKASTQHVGR